MSILTMAIAAALAAAAPAAQALEQRPNATLRIGVVAVGQPVAGATVQVADQEQLTGEDGVVVVQVASGSVLVVVRRDGFVDAELTVDLAPADVRRVTVELVRADIDEEVVVVASTRTGGPSRTSRCVSRCSNGKRSRRR